MGRMVSAILLVAVVAFAGAAAQSYYRLTSGPTFVDNLVQRMAGKTPTMTELGRKADEMLDKARDAVEEME